MVERAKPSNRRYLIAFVITLGVFLLGLFFGLFLSDVKLSQADSLELEFRNQIANIEVQNLLADNRICNIDNVDSLVEELNDIGSTLTSIEDDLGKNNKKVISLKEYYSLLEIRHMLYVDKYNKECDKDYKIILFFYSNDDKKCPDCEYQGYVLSYLRTKYPNIKIYSFDTEINNPAIKTLMDINKVKSVPSLVINGILYNGYKDRDFLEDSIL